MTEIETRDVELGDSKPPPGRRMTEEEFVAWCDEDTNAEWVDGEVIVSHPVSLRHDDLGRFLLTVSAALATRRGLGRIFGPQVQVRLSRQRRRREPDVAFVSKARLDILRPNEIDGAPDLIVEIVSPESEERAWREKHLEYEAAGVREYWVVSPLSEHAVAYALGPDGRYTPIPAQGGVLRSSVLPGFQLKLEWLKQDPLPDPLDVLKEWGVL